jgi:Tetratricopeptide repeat.
VLDSQGKYEEAVAMHRRALEGYEEVLGREHPFTLTSVSNLGLVLDSQGKYEEAEAMHRRALEVRGKVLGREHPDTLNRHPSSLLLPGPGNTTTTFPRPVQLHTNKSMAATSAAPATKHSRVLPRCAFTPTAIQARSRSAAHTLAAESPSLFAAT